MESERATLLRALLEKWFEDMDAGRHPALEDLCRDHPELLPDVRRLLGRDHLATAALGSVGSTGEAGAMPDALGDFRVGAWLGSGASGHVYLARQSSLGRLVALKVLRHDAGRNARARTRFRREAEIAANLEHPNLVPVYEVGHADGYDYIAMKWLSGPALDALAGPLSSKEVAEIGGNLARALDEAHEAGVIHRDVKPGNVMIDLGTPYLLDFGLACRLTAESLTESGTSPGTLLYMSPEQLRAGHSTTVLDARTDVYSLGATLYELAGGRPPFPVADPARLLGRILLSDPPRLRSVDRDLETIIFRCLEKDRESRFGSAGELAMELDRYLAGERIQSRPVGVWGWAARRVRRHKVTACVVGGLILLSLVLAAVLLVRHARSQGRLEARLDRVESELERGNLRLAGSLLETLGEEENAVPRARELSRRREAAVVLEGLLDEVQERPEALYRPVLAGGLERIATLGGFPAGSPRERATALVWVVRAVVEGRANDARALLAGISPGRDSAALRCLVEGRSSWELPSSSRHGEQEHVFTLIAQRLGERPIAEQRAEIRVAKRAHRGARRLRYAELLAEADAQPESVLMGLETLRVEGRYPRSVLRNLIRQTLVVGETDGLDELLAEFRQRFPFEEWTPLDAAVFVNASWRLGEQLRGDEILSRARSLHPSEFDLLTLAARITARRGDREGTLRLLRKAAAVARRARERETAQVQALRIRAWTSPGWRLGLAPVDPGGQADLELLVRELAALASRATDRWARGEARALLARAQHLLGRYADAARTLGPELASDPGAAVRFELAQRTFAHYLDAVRAARNDVHAATRAQRMEAAYGKLDASARKARTLLRWLWSREGKGRMPPDRDLLADAYGVDAALAFYVGAYADCVESADVGLELYEECLSPETTSYLERLRAHASRRLNR